MLMYKDRVTIITTREAISEWSLEPMSGAELPSRTCYARRRLISTDERLIRRDALTPDADV